MSPPSTVHLARALAGEGAPAGPIARLPLQVGTTAHFGITRASIALSPAALLAISPLFTLGAWTFVEPVAVTFGLVLFYYAVRHVRAALRMRASDLVLDGGGLRVEGGPHGGRHFRWRELRPPYAEVEETTEPQWMLWRILYYLPSALFCFLPLLLLPVIPLRSEVTSWKLRLFERGRKDGLLLARTHQAVEAQSLRAAASSIAAIEGGRRYVAEAPAFPARIALCHDCGAPVPPDDAAQVPCGHCGTSVPLAAEVRGQAAADKVLRRGRERMGRMAAHLLRQPRALPVNVWLLVFWSLLLLTIPLTCAVILIWLSQADGAGSGPEVWLADRVGVLLLLPVVIASSTYPWGRAKLVNRGAMQLLTLGFGALAPAREGDPSRCRRCQGPLAHSGMGAVAQCPFCRSDNIIGIDLRPLVDKARAEQRTFDDLLLQRRRAAWAWGMAAAAGVIVLALVTAAVASATHALLTF